MERARCTWAPRRFFFLQFMAAIAAGLALLPHGAAQTASQGQPSVSPEDLKKASAVFRNLGQLMPKMQGKVQYPPPRTQSRLLPLLPESTVFYAAFPNYGETIHQALGVFQQEVKENADLRAWWQQGDMAKEGPQIENALEKFYALSQFLGDEIVVAGASEGKEDPKFLFLSEVKKPGLKDALRQALKDLAGKAKPAAEVFDDAELATAQAKPAARKGPGAPGTVILVRPDLVIGAEDVATLARFAPHSDQNHKDLSSTGFGQRLSRGYEGGASIIAGADLEAILQKIPPAMTKNEAVFQRTGFTDMKYVVLEHNLVAGQEASQIELSFTGPRRSIASWIAAPGPIGSLDFASPHAVFAIGLLLKDPVQIFEDIKDMATASNPEALDSMAQNEKALKISLKDDIYARLGGDITLELDTLKPPDATWRAIVKTTDPSGLLATVHRLLAAANLTASESDEDGVTYNIVSIPTGQKKQEIGYAVADSYLIIGSSRDAVAEAVRLHRSGESLAKAARFQAALPPGHGTDMSALLYQDSAAWAAIALRQFSPDLAESIAQARADAAPSVMAVYAEDNALREVSRSSGMDAGAGLIVAAIAIPNLLRARGAADQASAVSTIRTANVAQISYSIAYPKRGFARDLASLGPDPNGSDTASPEHANLIDSTLGDASCTAGAWCTKSGYRFTLVTACSVPPCRDYVVVGSPASGNHANKNYCSTSDSVVRSRIGPPLFAPISAAVCKGWAPVPASEVNQNPPQ